MRRRSRLLIACAVIAFLVISGLLARWLALENVERNAVLVVLRAEARGNAQAMLAQLHGCERSCRANVVADAHRLRRAGAVQILAYQSQTAYTLSSAVGDTRVAWKSSRGRLPVVQCIEVQRTGNAVSGLSVKLLSLSLAIPDTADC